MAYNKREVFLKAFFDKSADFPVIGGEGKAATRIESKIPKATTPASKPPVKPKKSAKNIRGMAIKCESAKLIKAFERLTDGMTLVDPREYYGALGSVSKRVLEWLKGQVADMKANETKTIDLPVKGAKLKVRKLAGDMYSGWVVDKKGDIEHLFDRLTLPALASQVMAVYEVYNPEEDNKFEPEAPKELHTLKEEIESINAELKSLKNKKDKAIVGKRLRVLIEDLANLHEKVENHKEEHQTHISDVHQKLEELRGMFKPNEAAPPVEDEQPEISDKVEAKQIGEPEKCPDCGRNPCQCFLHLPRPVIEVRPNGCVTVMFKSEAWTTLDKLNYCKAMKYIISKKRK